MKNKSFKAQFGDYTIPDDLLKLLVFQNTNERGQDYSHVIFLDTINKEGLKTYSEEESFLQSFIEFADPTGTGSTYGFWLKDSSVKNLDNCPIVAFGGEGGIHIMAQNIKELLRIVSYDVEPIIGDDCISFSDKEELIEEDEFEPSPYIEEYIDWLKTELNLEPVELLDEVEAIIAEAQEKYQESLNAFLKKYDIEN